MVMPDRRHRCLSVEPVRDENTMVLAVELLHISFAVHMNRKSVTSAQAIKVSTVVNIATAAVCCETSLTDSMQSVVK